MVTTERAHTLPRFPGEYKIAYEHAGFSTVVPRRIRVGLGFTATVNTELRCLLSESVWSAPVAGRRHHVDEDRDELRREGARGPAERS